MRSPEKPNLNLGLSSLCFETEGRVEYICGLSMFWKLADWNRKSKFPSRSFAIELFPFHESPPAVCYHIKFQKIANISLKILQHENKSTASEMRLPRHMITDYVSILQMGRLQFVVDLRRTDIEHIGNVFFLN